MSAATLFLTDVEHTRTSPITHAFRYRSCSWLVDLDALGDRTTPADFPWWLRLFASFHAKDHLGDPAKTWRENVTALARTEGIDIDGGMVLALTNATSLGYVFNPLTVYWCWDRDAHVACVIAEVHNTYGGRHAYVLRPDARGVAKTDKALYVSPFNDTSGQYTISVPVPTDRVDAVVTLHRPDQRPFVATWSGHAVHGRADVARALLRGPLAPHLVSARIRAQGIRLWIRRLPVSPRPSTPTRPTSRPAVTPGRPTTPQETS